MNLDLAHQDHLRLKSRWHMSLGPILNLPVHPFPHLLNGNKYQFLWTAELHKLFCLKCPVWYPAQDGLRICSHLAEISLSFILHPLDGHPSGPLEWGWGAVSFHFALGSFPLYVLQYEMNLFLFRVSHSLTLLRICFELQ